MLMAPASLEATKIRSLNGSVFVSPPVPRVSESTDRIVSIGVRMYVRACVCVCVGQTVPQQTIRKVDNVKRN